MTFQQLVAQVGTLINPVLALLASVALFTFLAGLTSYLYQGATNTHKLEESKAFMRWGILTLFVLFCVGGILNFFANDLFGTSVSTGGDTPGSPNDAFQFDSGSGVQTSGPNGAFGP